MQFVMNECLKETYYFDYSHAVVQQFIAGLDRELDPVSLAIQVYLKVRDGWRYSAYEFHTEPEDMKASAVMQREQGHCLDKAIILITCFRALGLPARLHLAKVMNHIAVEQLVDSFGTNELTPHGYVEVYLGEQWVACTPAFNKGLCDKLGVDVLEFDGINDSVFQAYDKHDGKFMEYLEDYGTFEDFPREFVLSNMEQHYPAFKAARASGSKLSF